MLRAKICALILGLAFTFLEPAKMAFTTGSPTQISVEPVQMPVAPAGWVVGPAYEIKDNLERTGDTTTQALEGAPGAVGITGPMTGTIDTSHTFTATVTPITTTVPITYSWQATGQTPVTHTGDLGDVVTFTWSITGTKNITVTAENTYGLVQAYYKHTTVPLFEDSGIELINVFQGDVAWGDYDNDGDLDIILTSFAYWEDYITIIYRNDGNGIFTDINAEIDGINGGSVKWGDYDNDGDLDILLIGLNIYNRTISKVYRNDGNDVFTDINAGLAGVWSFPVGEWGDYDNDGDLDIFLSGLDDSYNSITKIYRNDRDGKFTDINAAVFQDILAGSMAWGDYDNDGDLDILLTGNIGMTIISKIYRNDGHGVFTDINAALQPVNQSSVAWGDYDNDGDLDIILAGWAGPLLYEVTKIYRNDGAGVFTDIHAGLTNVSRDPTAAWGDYDNDGDLDILLDGCAIWNNEEGFCYISATEIYRNDGNGVFFNLNEALPSYVWEAPVSWGDYDNDNDLDLLIAGDVTNIYRNNTIIANTVPSAPTSLAASIEGEAVILSWDAANDAQTPAAGLTYNLRVGTTPGGTQIVAPMAATNGYRRVPQLGNANHGLFAILNNLPSGTYYWSVQAIDTAFAGSPFASESSFNVRKIYVPLVVSIE